MEISREEAIAIVRGLEIADDEGQLEDDGYRLLLRIASVYGEELFTHCKWLLKTSRLVIGDVQA